LSIDDRDRQGAREGAPATLASPHAQAASRRIAEVLHYAGAIAVPGALDPRICAGLIGEMREMPARVTSPISPETMKREHDPSFVRSKTLVPSPFAQAVVELAIARHTASLAAFFARPLELNTELHFLTYGPGGFIKPHCDLLEGDHVLEKIRERVVVFTLFLNGAAGPGRDTFEGGDFVLHPSAAERIVIPCVPGMLIAFRAEVVHSVREVTAGSRHAVTGWFRAPHRAG
jgi:predicted 2-oxoglutarate/Fe(II)-dependent dioxygenase YbiX